MRRWAYAIAAIVVVIVVAVATSGDPITPPAAASHDPVLVFRPHQPPAPGVPLEGLVVDESARPVEGATVTLGHQHTTSDTEGRFAFAALPGRYRLSAHTGDGYAPHQTITLDARTEPVVLHLVRGATVVVTVLADDHPIAGAEVRLDETDTMTTDTDGIARFTGRWPDWILIDARAPGFALETSRAEIDPGGLIEQTLRLHRGAALAGVVVDEQSAPVANAKLSITSLDTGQAADATSDAQGRWRVDAVAAGRYHASAIATGLGPTIAPPIVLDGKTPRDGIVVRVARGGTLAGIVVDTKGAPQAGIEIDLQQSARVDWKDTRATAVSRSTELASSASTASSQANTRSNKKTTPRHLGSARSPPALSSGNARRCAR